MRGRRTLTAVPAEAARHICGLNGAFLTGLQEHKQPLELVWDTGDRILLRFLKLPTGAEKVSQYISVYTMHFGQSDYKQ